MNKYYSKSKFIIISLTTLMIFLSMLIGNISMVEKNIEYGKSHHSKNAIDLEFVGYTEGEIRSFFNEVKKVEGLIIKYYYMTIPELHPRDLGGVLGIYFNDKYNKTFNMKSGRFLNKDDFDSDNKVAVIGEDIEPYTEKDEDNQYVVIGNSRYKVVGIVKGNGEIKNSDFIYYNLNPVIKKEHNIRDSWWIIDSESKDSDYIINELYKINDKFKNKEILVKEYEHPYQEGDSIYLIFGMVLSLGLCSITILLTLIRSIIMWVNMLKVEIGVRFTCGSTKKGIIALLIMRYSFIVILSSIISTALLFILTKMNLNSIILFKFDPKIIMVNFLIGILTGILLILIITFRFKALKASKLLRGGI